jgi:integrase
VANKKVSLVRVCKTDAGWKRLPIVMGRNGKIRPGYALVNGEAVLFPEGYYALRRYEGKKTVYEAVGNDAADALAAQQRKTHLLLAKNSADAAGVKIVGEISGRVSLSKKRDEYIQRHLAKGQVRASETSTIAIDDFIEATRHTYADQITEASVLTFYTFLRKRGNQDRTIYNKHVSLFGLFKWLGLDTKKLAERPPSYTEKEVSVFHPEDLKTLFDSCSGYQKVVFETLLKTGMRMQEAMHLEWTNVDFRTKKIRVRERLDDDTENDVRIKDRAERSIPLSDDLALSLKQLKKDRPKSHLVLGTANDTPNWKWLQMLKRAVRKAELNCGRCKGCKSTAECSRWKIHQFRATYTTMLLRGGVDVRTVMSYTGHADMATVMRYLTPADSKHTQSKINSIEWTT